MTAITNIFFTSPQAFAGAPPFGRERPSAVMLAIKDGERPPRPPHSDISGGLWKLIQQCWVEDPALRPEASEVLRILINLLVPHSFWGSSIS